MNPQDLMQLALGLAKKAAEEDEVPIGAVLFQNGQVIGEGYNRRERSGKTTGHAEIEALEDYNRRTGQWRLPPETDLYVTIEPCMMCTGALLTARASRIFYGAPDPKGAGLSLFRPLIDSGTFDHQFEEVLGGVLKDECSELISHYFRRKRAQKSSKS